MHSAPAPVNISAAPSTPSVASAPAVPSVPAAAMPSTNVAVIGAPQQETQMRRNTGGIVPQSSGNGPTVAFLTPTNSDSISRLRAQKEYNILGTA